MFKFKNIDMLNILVPQESRNYEIEVPEQCPHCNAYMDVRHIKSIFIEHEKFYMACCFFVCPKCERGFMNIYSICTDYQKDYSELTLIKTFPQIKAETIFEDSIKELSSDFVCIYNEAKSAEENDLFLICGLGYRKSIEFLVKDFSIKNNPDDKDSIRAMPLAQCIKKYIKEDSIRTLAERSAWIGNDEAHYVRKHEDRDISDMKNFIHALVYFISMTLVVEDAASMNPKK